MFVIKKAKRKMSSITKHPKVLHIFWNNAPHLTVPFSIVIAEMFPNHEFSLFENELDEAPFEKGNEKFRENISGKYFGKLKCSFLHRIFQKSNIIKSIVDRFFLGFSIFTLLKLVLGPRYIVLHGRSSQREFNLVSFFLLKLVLKKIYLIHWGGRPTIGRRIKFFDLITYKMFSHIFVLMAPELEYFKPMVGEKVSCLPYWHKNLNGYRVNIPEERNPRTIILGNSTHNRENYREVLDRLNPNDWDNIICMLNYGDERNASATDKFVAEYKNKFSNRFYAWRETLPYEEYLKVMSKTTFYICINKTQSGLGAISNSICLGKTIILRGDNFKWMSSLGVKVYDYDEFPDLSFDRLKSLILCEEEAQKSLDNFNENAAMKYTKMYWKNTILSHLA